MSLMQNNSYHEAVTTVFMTLVLLLVSVKLLLRYLQKDLIVDQRAEVKLGYEDI